MHFWRGLSDQSAFSTGITAEQGCARVQARMAAGRTCGGLRWLTSTGLALRRCPWAARPCTSTSPSAGPQTMQLMAWSDLRQATSCALAAIRKESSGVRGCCIATLEALRLATPLLFTGPALRRPTGTPWRR